MVLSAVGDAMGYKNGDWEFNTSSKIIHQEMMELTKNKGIKELKINLEWRYSDDTVMHIATADALIAQRKNLNNINKVAQQIAVEYKESGKRMSGRAPGKTCMKSIMILNADGSNWDKIPFRDRSVGCGGSMRSACIGLVYWKPEQVK
jgi:ADP-ribosylarginine hydrolase